VDPGLVQKEKKIEKGKRKKEKEKERKNTFHCLCLG
jgi:hypothetical protein